MAGYIFGESKTSKFDFYPRKNYIVHDVNYYLYNHSHVPLTYYGKENIIVINFKYLNFNIDIAGKCIVIYERYTDRTCSSSLFYESISFDDFLKYDSKFLQKVLFRVIRRKFAEADITNKNWGFSLQAINSDVISEIKNLIIKECKL